MEYSNKIIITIVDEMSLLYGDRHYVKKLKAMIKRYAYVTSKSPRIARLLGIE